MSHARYLIGDVFDRMAEIPDGSIDLVLTSPPFLALRSYLPADHPDKGKEIGSEPDPASFLDTLLALTAEWRRLLAPHGSIAVELGDTYSGSGGAGGDYAEDGLRAGQNAFNGSAKAARWGLDPESESKGRGKQSRPNGTKGEGWPLPKSLCGIPHLYHLSLAYGVNLLTGEPSPAGRWRVRNVVAWCRPNPPVGALGDKFRPGTSYMTIATVAVDRYFDLDAVRFPADPANKRKSALVREGIGGRTDQVCNPIGEDGQRVIANAAGAPPLDWWEIPTQPYKGSHYATWPERLLERPILSMAPQRVCTTCGEPSRRIVVVEHVSVRGATQRGMSEGNRRGEGVNQWTAPDGSNGSGWVRQATTTGWTDCGHDSWRPGVVLDPFAGSGTTLAVATGHGRDCIGIDLDARNADLARERVGMFLDVEYPASEVPASEVPA